ncbi:single-stranded DNA-binding protein, mitochondrial [Dermatophagoides farinae]|uniref:Single-stranded dna-binding protein n=1 Tax=Dermatophagoides farinae TaxID=6954 RepID=A0A922HXE8_DERFA|nr:single-stranded DNA-binding protein, mitochondrial-like [Dermatophagoides farinae]KAH7646096.1 single-stranded dna-binding protein [Dermatophagoides farinae]KAH9516444.1 Single-stranded DNA-binding protein, mitochondrial [Dermatophagoides farinae]
MAHQNIKNFHNLLRSRFLSDTLRFSSSKTSSEIKIPDNSKCINKVILLGRCLAEANLKPLNNTNYATFIMATNELRRTKSNEIVKRSDYHKVFVYQPFLAKKSHNLITKGTRLYLEGKLNYRKYENQFFSNIVAEKILFISGTNQQFELDNDDIIEEIDEEFITEGEEQQNVQASEKY